MRTRRLHWVMCLSLAYFAGSCGDSHGDDHSHDDGQHDHEPTDDTAMCEKDADTFSISLAKDTAKGTFNVSFSAADPAPPDVGENTWTLVVKDKAGKPIEGAKLTAEPRMPHHNHGTNPTTFDSKAGSEAGSYTIGPMTLPMSGFWKITLTVQDGDKNTDEVEFIFCLEG